MHPRITQVSDFLLSSVLDLLFCYLSKCVIRTGFAPWFEMWPSLLSECSSKDLRGSKDPRGGGTTPSGANDSSPGPKLGRWSQDCLPAVSIFLTGAESPLISGPWSSPSIRLGKSFPLTAQGLKVLVVWPAHGHTNTCVSSFYSYHIF